MVTTYKYHSITASTDSGDLYDYPIQIIVYKCPGTDNENEVYCDWKCRDDFEDIRFYVDDNTTLASYWLDIDSTIFGSRAVFWVKMPVISTEGSILLISYGGEETVTTSSGDDTFDFFSEFTGEDIDSDKWELVGATNTYVILGHHHLRVSDTGNTWPAQRVGWRAKKNGTMYSMPTNNYAIEIKDMERLGNREIGYTNAAWRIQLSNSSPAYEVGLGYYDNDEFLQVNGYVGVNVYTRTIHDEFYKTDFRITKDSLSIKLYEKDTLLVSGNNSTVLDELFLNVSCQRQPVGMNLGMKIRRIIVRAFSYYPPVHGSWWIYPTEEEITKQNTTGMQIELQNDYTRIEDMSNWYSTWSYRISHIITAATLRTNYQIRINVSNHVGNSIGDTVYCNGNCNEDFSDIRFTSADGVTLLDHFRESYIPGENAVFWVEVDSIPASPSTKTIFVYYGNPDAVSASNGDSTFLFFDDFDVYPVSGNKWEEVGNAHYYTVEDSKLKITGKVAGDWGAARVGFRAKSSFSTIYNPPDNSIAVEMKMSWQNNELGYYHNVGIALTNGSTNYVTMALGDPWGSASGQRYASVGAAYHEEVVNAVPFVGEAILKITKDQSNNINQYWNSVLKMGPTNNATALTELFIFTNQYLTTIFGTFYIDYIFVRKFISPEAQHSSWGNTESRGIKLQNNEMTHIITTFHSSEYLENNSININLSKPADSEDTKEFVEVMKIKGNDEVNVVHILPLENEIYNVGSDERRWLLATGSQMFNDTTQTKTLNLHSGR